MKLTDKQLIDALAEDIAMNGPLVLWDGKGEFPAPNCGIRGLSFGYDRAARTAISYLAPAREKAAKKRATRKDSQ